MLIDGNDDRGIDVAIMTREDYPIVSIASHVDDAIGRSCIFSRDCPQFEIRTAKGNPLFVLVNHLKSKGFGSKAASDARRQRQARRVKEIYDELVSKHRFVAIIGDLNDTPASAPLAVLTQDPTLKDISAHPNFDDGGRPGTFGNGTASNKIDYIHSALARTFCPDQSRRHFPHGGVGRQERHPVPPLPGNHQSG